MCIAWRKGLRRVWELPFNTHCDLLPLMCCSISIFDELYRRTALFINQCLSSECLIISNIARYGVFFYRMMSPLGKNAFHCCNRYGTPFIEINEVSSAFINQSVELTVEIDLRCRVNLLLELIFIRDRTFTLSPAGLTSSEVMELINYLCTS